MPFVPAHDGVVLHYTSTGAGRPIVLVHGWTMSSRVFHRNIDELAQDHRVVTVDVRGHGLSGRDLVNISLNQAARDLETVLAHLDLQDIVLTGSSMGMGVVYEYMQVFGTGRLRGAVDVDMTPYLFTESGWEHGLFGSLDAAASLVLQNQLLTDRSAITATAVNTMFAAGADVAPDEWQFWCDELTNVPSLAALALWVSLTSSDYRPLLPRIDVPVLLAHGVRSQICPTAVWEVLADAIPRTTTILFENSGHTPFLEEPARFNAELINFVDGL